MDDTKIMPTVSTVTGKVPAGTLGITLAHEHIIHRISRHSGKADNTCLDTDVMAEELARFKAAGGGTVCDVTPLGLGRDPPALREVSKKSGVQIVSGVGLYMEDGPSSVVGNLSGKALSDFIIFEAEGGHAGIPAGLIGEIASHNEPHSDWKQYRLTDREEAIFHAVADAQRRTGLPVVTHASLGRGGVAQLRALLNGGADLGRIVIGHCDAQSHSDPCLDLEYYHRLLAEGASVSFDLFGWEELIPNKARYERIALLAGEGFSDRILLSTDTCRLSQLHAHGGRGFDYMQKTVLPELSGIGVPKKDLHRMIVSNPARLLSQGIMENMNDAQP